MSQPQPYTDEYTENYGLGDEYDFHGAFARKADAVRKERQVGGFIIERMYHLPGSRRRVKRYLVLTTKHRPNPQVFVMGNPGGEVFGVVHEIRYRHKSHGNRVHEFGSGVQVEALPDGSMRIFHPSRRVWENQ